MKKLNVETPEEWKSGLFLRLEKNKKPVIRPVVLLAACLAAVICLSASAFAVSAVRAPEYFGSLFLGQSETADALYSPKNIVFDTTDIPEIISTDPIRILTAGAERFTITSL